jgi:HK97 family phage major capsid protein
MLADVDDRWNESGLWPDGSNNTFPVLFGDFRRANTLADRTDLRITVDNNITSPGYIKYFLRKRVHGSLTNVDVIKALKTAA